MYFNSHAATYMKDRNLDLLTIMEGNK